MIIDSMLAVREGLGAFLESQQDFKIVAMAQSGRGAAAIWGEARPDLVLLEMELPDGGGLEAVRALRLAHPETKVILLTNSKLPQLLDQARAAGAVGVLPKGVSGAELCDAIRWAIDRA
jgi:DNA-binding NarL/FixJ family response regulator